MNHVPMTKEDFEAILSNIQYTKQPTWRLLLRYDEGGPFLQVEDKVGKDNFVGADLSWRGRKWDLSPHMCVSEVIRTAYKAIQAAEEHEMNECFRYQNIAVFDPHRKITANFLEGPSF